MIWLLPIYWWQGLSFDVHPVCVSLSSRTSQPQRKALGTASRPWPLSWPLCLGSRKIGWSCTIRTGTPPLLIHRSLLKETSRLKFKTTLVHAHWLDHLHAHAETQLHTEKPNFCKSIYKFMGVFLAHSLHATPRVLLRWIPYCIGLLLQWTDTRRLFFYIFHKDYWKERTGAWYVCEWETFLNELKG